MVKAILFGNGINARIGINGLSEQCVKERFLSNILRYNPLFKALYNIDISEDKFIEIFRNGEDGIESLAGELYLYIKCNVENEWNINYDIWLQDLVTCIAMTSIFYTSEGIISNTLDYSKMPDISDYDKVFSLNYYDFWDSNKVACHLHGKIDINEISSKRNLLIVSRDRMKYDVYKKTVEELSETNRIQVMNINNMIFAPNGIEKNHLICVEGLYPSERLYPAADLFLYSKKELYKELSQVDELDIFGMSPYGDESLIDEINRIEHVNVFVYKMISSKETEEWERKLTCDHKICDSADM
ncbi:MAG: hypothetical protein IJ691_09920 [Lachnospiraceae bacterium]|nr:hypothetical protein [Lachnospiraceae bacterium]